jgi:hypothetical protein
VYVIARPARPVKEPDGLGIFWLIPILVAAAASVGTAAATRLISGPSSPSQKQVEAQLKLQQQLEIERMVQQQQLQQQQVQQLAKYALPALGLVALVAVLR